MKRHTKIRDCCRDQTNLYEESYKTILFGIKQKNLYDKSYNKCGVVVCGVVLAWSVDVLYACPIVCVMIGIHVG